MSDIVGKTVSSLHGLLGKSVRGLSQLPDELIKETIDQLMNLSTKQDEDKAINQKLLVLERNFKEYGTKSESIEKNLLLSMYLEMVGYSTPFAYIHAVKLAQQGNLRQKQIGYLACSVFLHPDHELVLLLINTIQKDLNSSNPLEICLALKAVPQFIKSETVSTVQLQVERKLSHPNASVRMNALLALNHCFSLCDYTVLLQQHLQKLERGLGDDDIDVVATAISCLKVQTKVFPDKMNHVVSALLKIFRQLLKRVLPASCEFHSVSLPWLQICLLQFLGDLNIPEELHNEVEQTLKDVLLKTEANQVISYAIIYECVLTIAKSMKHSDDLISHAMECIAKLLHSNNVDLNYSGVSALEKVLSECHPSEAIRCQEVIIECLHHPDESVRIKTLDLLLTMANVKNVKVITSRIINYIPSTSDEALRKVFLEKVIHLLQSYPADLLWVASTFSSLVLMVPNLITDAMVNYFITQFETNVNVTQSLCGNVQKYCELTKETTSGATLHFIIWVLGEVHKSIHAYSNLQAQEQLCKLLQKNFDDDYTCLQILSALGKLILNSKEVSPQLKDVLDSVMNSHDSLLIKQKAFEISNLAVAFADGDPGLIVSQKVTMIDTTLSFLDKYVCEALEKGAVPYKPRRLLNIVWKDSLDTEQSLQGLKPDSLPTASSVGSISESGILSPDYLSLHSSGLSLYESPKRPMKVWTSEGRKRDLKPDASEETVKPEHEVLHSEDNELIKALFVDYSKTSEDPQTVARESSVSADSHQTPVETTHTQHHIKEELTGEGLWGIEIKRKQTT